MKKLTPVLLIILIIATLWLYACGPSTIQGRVVGKQVDGDTYRIELKTQTISVTQAVYEAVVVGNHYTFDKTGQGDYDEVIITLIVMGE